MNKEKTSWPSGAKEKVNDLHKELSIDHINWHKLKANKRRRAAEFIISGLSQLMNEGDPEEIAQLLLQAIKWSKGEVKDLGCPDKKGKKNHRLQAS